MEEMFNVIAAKAHCIVAELLKLTLFALCSFRSGCWQTVMNTTHESQIKRTACNARVCGELTNSDEIHGNWPKQCHCYRKVFE